MSPAFFDPKSSGGFFNQPKPKPEKPKEPDTSSPFTWSDPLYCALPGSSRFLADGPPPDKSEAVARKQAYHDAVLQASMWMRPNPSPVYAIPAGLAPVWDATRHMLELRHANDGSFELTKTAQLAIKALGEEASKAKKGD